MDTVRAAVILVAVLALATGLDGADALQRRPTTVRSERTQEASNAVSSTVVASYVVRDGQRLVLLVLWRGSPAWLANPTGSSSGSRNTIGRTSLRLTFGGLTFNADVDDTAGVATVLGQQIPLKDTNVVLVDDVDSAPRIVRTAYVDPAVPDVVDPGSVVLKRQPELIEFLQCDLMRSGPLLQMMRPEYLKAWMAVHPCGQAIAGQP